MSSVEQDEKGLWCQNLSESVKVYCKNGTERKQVYLWAEKHGWTHKRFKEKDRLLFSCWDWMMYQSVGAIHANAKRLCKETEWYMLKVPCCICKAYELEYYQELKPIPAYIKINQYAGNTYDDDKKLYFIEHNFTRGVEIIPPFK